MAFIEAEFPKTISYKAMGGPTFNTTVNEGKSGFEQRNQNWQTVRGEWTVSLNTPSASTVNPQTFIDQLTAFFLVVGGKANAFRLKDHKDFTNGSAPVQIGTGDAATTYFQLIKKYTAAGLTYSRTISKPVTSKVVDYLGNALADSVDIYLNGGAALPRNAGYIGGGTAKYSLDETTGLVNFGSASTVVTVTGYQNSTDVAGFMQLLCTWTGPAPQRNQQLLMFNAPWSPGVSPKTILSVSGTASAGFITVNTAGVGSTTVAGFSSYTAWGCASITQAVVSLGTTTTYSYTMPTGGGLAPAVGQRVYVQGFVNASNNGMFYITAVGTGTFSVTNAGVNETHAATGVTDWVPQANTVITWTGNFHFPVRFDTDQLALQLEESDVEGGHPIVSWNSIVLREVRIISGQSQG